MPNFAVLPVNFRTAWPILRKAIAATQLDAILMLGEKTGCDVAIETTAQNRRRYRKEHVQIEKSGTGKTSSVFDIRALTDAIRSKSASAKQALKVSHNAGDYLCNFIYWKVLTHNSAIPSIFLHVPAMAIANSQKEITHIARQTKMLIDAMQKQVRHGFNALSAQKQLTVPGQKAGRAKRKKGA